MKKIFLLFLISISSYGQAVFEEGIQVTGGQPTVTTVNYLPTVEADGLFAKISPVLLPISTATQTALDNIENKIPVNYSKIVYVNNNNPNSATIFSLDVPPLVNDDLLKNDVANLYIGLDASTWVYSGSNYVTKVVTSETSNFYLSGTTTDAGNSKTGNISRTGSLESKSFIKTGATVDQALVGDGSVRTLSDVQNGVVQSLQPYRINLSNFNNEKPLDLNTRRNLIINSETYTTANNFFTANSATIDNNDIMYFQGIKMVKLKDANFFSNLNIRQTNLVTGKRYMFSYYVKSNVGEDFIFDDIGDSNQSGHRRRFIDSSVRRVYWIGQAISNTFLDKFLVPTTSMGSGTGSYATIGVSKTFTASAANPYGNMYIGGVQIEEIPDTYVDGVVWMGDSTIAGDAGLNNGYQNTAIPSLFSDIMNCSSFNKGVAGERLDQIDARWATSVTPLKNNSKYVIIQGGLNDIGQGTRTLADMQASINSMNAKALTDGLIPIYLTCSPNDNFDATQETLRDNFNYWLLTTFVKVIDINNAIEFNSKLTQGFPRYVTDGIHYGLTLRKAVAGFIAKSPFFEFLKPSDYQATTATYTGKDLIAKNVSVEQITTTVAPTTSAGGYDILTRNTTSGLIEKVPSTTFAPNLLTGFTPTGGTILATDTVLQAIQKLNGNIAASPLYGTLSGSASLDFPATIVGASSDLQITVTGAAVGDVVSIGVPIFSVVPNGIFTAFVGDTNLVTIRFSNLDIVSANDPGPGTFKVKVLK